MTEIRTIKSHEIRAGQTIAFLGIEEQHVGTVVKTDSGIGLLGIQDWRGDIVWYIDNEVETPEWEYTLLRAPDEQEAAHRKALGEAWSAFLGLALAQEFDGTGMSVLEYILKTDPALRERFRKALQ